MKPVEKVDAFCRDCGHQDLLHPHKIHSDPPSACSQCGAVGRLAQGIYLKEKERSDWAKANINTRTQMLCPVCQVRCWVFIMKDGSLLCSRCEREAYHEARECFDALGRQQPSSLETQRDPQATNIQLADSGRITCENCTGVFMARDTVELAGSRLCVICASALSIIGETSPEPVSLDSFTSLLEIKASIGGFGDGDRTWDSYKPKKGDDLLCVCFSGITIKRRHTLMQLAESQGMTVKKSMTKKVRIFIVGPERREHKIEDAKKRGIAVVDENGFIYIVRALAEGRELDEILQSVKQV